MKMISLFVSVLTSVFILQVNRQAVAAPHPASGSSLLNTVQNSVVFSQLGFDLKNIPHDWQLQSPLETSLLEIGPKDKTVLSFRTEPITTDINLEKYVRQYLRDYNQYGFEVMGLQSLAKTKNNTVVVDLIQKNKAVKSRQVFYKKNNEILLATCLDIFENFDRTINICNQVLNTLSWKN